MVGCSGSDGLLDYVSPDANVVTGFVEESWAMVDICSGHGNRSPGLRKHVDQIQTEHGLITPRHCRAAR